MYGFLTGRLTCLTVDSMGNLTDLTRASFEALQAACGKAGVCMDSMRAAVASFTAAFPQEQRVFVNPFKGLFDSVIPEIASLQEQFNQLFPNSNLVEEIDTEVCWDAPPRVRHLAHNHPKARVRNKNWNRMYKIHERYIQCKR